MMNIDIFKQEVDANNLLQLGFYAPTQFNEWFGKLSMSAGIDLQLHEAIQRGNLGKVPVFYLKYNVDNNLLYLNFKRFSYVNQSWTYFNSNTSMANEVKWITNNNSDYRMSYTSASLIGKAFNKNIPVIYRNI